VRRNTLSNGDPADDSGLDASVFAKLLPPELLGRDFRVLPGTELRSIRSALRTAPRLTNHLARCCRTVLSRLANPPGNDDTSARMALRSSSRVAVASSDRMFSNAASIQASDSVAASRARKEQADVRCVSFYLSEQSHSCCCQERKRRTKECLTDIVEYQPIDKKRSQARHT
jgi:hypothetical protein